MRREPRILLGLITAAAAGANLAIAFAWSFAGALGRDADPLERGLVAAPAALA